jgi:hypothetical protein
MDGSASAFFPLEDGGTQPDAAATCVDPNHCIRGTARLNGFKIACISAQCRGWRVQLYGTYPASGVQPIAPPQLVAMDGTWTFDALGTGGGAANGYYVRAEALFTDVEGGSPSVVTGLVGPVSVPASDVAIDVGPLQATAYEARPADGPMMLDWVAAHLYDPSGVPITTGANVSVTVGSTPVELPLTTLDSVPAYYAGLSPSLPAQSTYTVTATHPAFGDAGVSVVLVADPPPIDGGVASAYADGGAVAVSWTPQPLADFEVIELFAQQADGGWAFDPSFTSSGPLGPAQTSETTPALDAGTYLVNVAYAGANCPAGAGGCVQANVVATTTVVVP